MMKQVQVMEEAADNKNDTWLQEVVKDTRAHSPVRPTTTTQGKKRPPRTTSVPKSSLLASHSSGSQSSHSSSQGSHANENHGNITTKKDDEEEKKDTDSSSAAASSQRVSQNDPRWHIRNFFKNLGEQEFTSRSFHTMTSHSIKSSSTTANHNNHNHNNTTKIKKQKEVFTVWRPTSRIAMQRMMAAEATGKGLEIKGKSSKTGRLSGYVPYLQIHAPSHKHEVKTLARGGRTRIFYDSQADRDYCVQQLTPLQNQMLNTVQDAKRAVKQTVEVGWEGGVQPVLTTLHSAALSAGVPRPAKRVVAGAQSIVTNTKTKIQQAVATATSSSTVLGQRNDISSSSNTSASGTDNLGGARDMVRRMNSSMQNLSHGVIPGAGMARHYQHSKNANTCMASPPPALTKLDCGVSKDEKREWALKRLLYDMDDPSIRRIDDYAPDCYGMELPDRLLWKACVMDRDISRPEGSDLETGRTSEPAFQDMNFIAIEKTRKNRVEPPTNKKNKNTMHAMFASLPILQYNGAGSGAGGNGGAGQDDDAPPPPRVVLKQTSVGSEALDPRGLIMAYEEDGRVLPVVSDFDCFTMGSKGIKYTSPLPPEQLDLLHWCVTQIEFILKDSRPTPSWTSCWLEVLKTSASKGFHPTVPRYGFGDPKSYGIMESAVETLKEQGSVRHGAECFNYYFPQDLDEEFLIVSDRLVCEEGQDVPWKYVNATELQTFLKHRIEEGFTFPLNPKWVLCDPGWKDLYNQLVASQHAHVQDSLAVWFPHDVRQRIEAIHAAHPVGFVSERQDEECGTEAMDLATTRLDYYLASRRAKAKMKAVIRLNYMFVSVRKRRGVQYFL